MLSRRRLNELGTRRGITLPKLGLFYLLLLALCALLVWSESTLKVDRLLHDSWVRADQRQVPGDVFIAAIDNDSLDELGRWPWPRDVQAKLFERLAEYGVRGAVIDLLYPEPSDERADDQRLAAAIGSLQESVLPILTESGIGQVSIETLPTADITREVSNLGHVFLPIDDDGIVRRVYLKAGVERAHWPTLSLAMLERLGLQPDPLPGKISNDASRTGRWVQDYEVYIPFYGRAAAFPRVSVADIIRGNVRNGLLRNKIVFVGLTTTGLGDVVPTPVSGLENALPGVEVHANIFSSLRDGSMVVALSPYTALLVAFLLVPVMLVVYSRAPPEWGLVCAAAGSIAPILLSFLLYSLADLWFSPLSASVPMLASYLFWSRHRLQYVNRFLEKEHRRAKDDLPARVVSDTAALARFFTSAARHLPIDAWRFSMGRESFCGGGALPALQPALVEDRWAIIDGVYTRRYPLSKGLQIEMKIADDAIGQQLADYVDSLARVRAHEQARLISGSIERLQTNVLTVSEQLEWLRNVKVFSDTMLAAAPSGFAVWNPAGEVIRANALTYELVEGYRENGDLMHFISCLQRNPESGEDAKHFSNLIIHRRPWQIAYRQGERELIVSFRAVGDVLLERLVCVSVVDVSDIRTAEKARAEMVDYLSHDLRSPLISALCVLESDADPRIASNIRNSLAMMDDLLHVARADSLTESGFKPLLLNAVLDNTLDQLLPQALDQGIRFDISTDDEDLWVVGDASSLERAFTNIVGNAIKYSSPGTQVKTRLTGEGQNAVLTVDDEGVGIDPKMLDQLFTRFKRDASTADEHKGIGLGLALVARVINLHGGHVKADNLPVGTRITLTIPLEDEQSDHSQARVLELEQQNQATG